MKPVVTFYIVLGLIAGTVVACLLSIFQSILIGSDYLLLKSYMVPSATGAIAGVVISFLWYRSNRILAEKLEVEEKANIDDLTGLYNRRGFFILANHQIMLANRNRKNTLLVYIDIDNLKEVNDSMGHHEGDKMLIETASILKDTFRKSDIIARMGGDEFVVFPVESADGSYNKIICHLKDNLESFNKSRKGKFRLSLSFGKAIYEYRNPITIDKLLSVADTRMYSKKRKNHKI